MSTFKATASLLSLLAYIRVGDAEIGQHECKLSSYKSLKLSNPVDASSGILRARLFSSGQPCLLKALLLPCLPQYTYAPSNSCSSASMACWSNFLAPALIASQPKDLLFALIFKRNNAIFIHEWSPSGGLLFQLAIFQIDRFFQ